MEKGKATTIPGIYSTEQADRWVVRTRKPEKAKVVGGTFAQAHAALEAMKVEHEQLQAGQPVAGTLAAMGTAWLYDTMERRQSKPAFLANRAFHLKRFIDPFFGHLRIEQVKAKNIIEWKDWLLKQTQPAAIGKRSNPHEGERYAHSTLHTVWTTFRTFAGFAAMQMEVRNPMDSHRFDVYGEVKEKGSALTQREVLLLVPQLDREKPDIRCLILLGLATGCRFAEYSALTETDVDFNEKTIKITKSQIDGHVGRPKTESTRRLVHIPEGIVRELQAHREWLGKQKRANPKGLLFPTKHGGYRAPADLRNPLRRAAMRAGVSKHLTAHCLRRTTNNLLRQSTSETVTRGMIGHSTTEMTMLYSLVERDERMEALAKAFGGLFNSGDQPMGTSPKPVGT